MNSIHKIDSLTFITSENPDKNYGGSNQAYAFKNNEKEFKTLIWFDVNQELIDFNNNSDTKVIVRLYNSVMRLLNNSFSLKCSPITKPWKEGLGSIYNNEKGVSWSSTGFENWDNDGGDYIDSIVYDTDINTDNFYTEIDVSDFISRIESGEDNHGIILYSDEGSAYNFAFYSEMDRSGFNPMLIKFEDNYYIDQETTAKLYEGDFPVLLKTYRDKYDHEKGEMFLAQIGVYEKFRRDNLFFEELDVNYLPNLKYKLVDETRKKIIYDYSEFTKVPVKKNGLFLSISTMNLPKGVYYIMVKYENDNDIYYSQRVNFRIV